MTRAMAAPRTKYTVDAAELLLRKKLAGVLHSTETCCSDTFAKQVLHVWTPDECSAQAVDHAYARLDPSLIADTIVLVTICGLTALFTEKALTKRSPALRKLKGTKDEQHLHVLRESDPMRHNQMGGDA